LARHTIAWRSFASQGDVVEVKVPEMGDSITEGTILTLMRKPGDYVESEQAVAEVETDKVTVEARSPHAGTIKELFVSEGETVLVGGKFFSIAVGVGEPSVGPPVSTSPAPPPATAAPPATTPSAPSAAPSAASPTAPTAAPAVAPAASASPAEAYAAPRERRVKLTRMRKTIAANLKAAQNELAQLTTFNEIDMTAVNAMRKKYKDDFAKKHEVKFGFQSVFVMAAARALTEQPIVNACISGDDVLYRDYVNIGFAAATPTGLVVPVLRDVQAMSILDIERETGRLAGKAKSGKISLDDLQGSTFSITNGGIFGSLFSTPILTPPQSAILGMHGVFDRPKAVGGQVVIRPMMYVALTYDHRIIDGREAVIVLKRIKEFVEDPVRLLLDV